MDFSSPSWNPLGLQGASGGTTSSSATRKRPRSTSPTPARGRHHAKALVNTPDGAELALQLRDPDKRIVALNSLLVASASHEANYALGANGEDVLDALVSLVHESLKWRDHEKATMEDHAKEQGDDGQDDDEQEKHDYSFVASTAWSNPPNKESMEWALHCQGRLAARGADDGDEAVVMCKILDAVLVILRNLSFVAANLRLMAHSPPVLAVLVGCLYDTGVVSSFMGGASSSSSSASLVGDESASSNSRGNLSLHALQTLVHLAPYLDVTGQKLYADKLFLDPTKLDDKGLIPKPEQYGQALVGMGWGGLHLAKRLDTKEDIVLDVEPRHILEMSGEYLVGVWSIFPALARVLVDRKSPRAVIMVALDMFKELLDQATNTPVDVPHEDDDDTDDDRKEGEENKDEAIPNAREIMVNIPDNVLDRLVDLLWIPRLGPDSLEYLNPVNNIVSRVSTLKLLMGYDATVDTDLRDRSLDVLVPLLELQSNTEDNADSLSQRLGCTSKRIITRSGNQPTTMTRTRLYDALVPILTTNVGRNDAPNLASELLVELAKSKQNQMGLAYIQERLLFLASRGDVRIAQLACNHLYKKKEEPNEEEQEETKEEQGQDAL